MNFGRERMSRNTKLAYNVHVAGPHLGTICSRLSALNPFLSGIPEREMPCFYVPLAGTDQCVTKLRYHYTTDYPAPVRESVHSNGQVEYLYRSGPCYPWKQKRIVLTIQAQK